MKRPPFWLSLIPLALLTPLFGQAPPAPVLPPVLKFNDPNYDNAPALSYYGTNGIPVPAGTLYIKSTIDCGTGVGGGLVGAGMPDQSRSEGWRKYGPDTTHIIDARPMDHTEPMLRIRRSVFGVKQIGFTGCRIFAHPDYRVKKGKGALIEIDQKGAEWGVGETTFDEVCLTNAEYGIWHADNGDGGGHCDHTRARRLTTHTLDYVIVHDDNQSVVHNYQILAHGNGGKAVIWARDGGKIYAEIHTNGDWESYLDLGYQPTDPATGQPLPDSAPPHNNMTPGAKMPSMNTGHFNLTVDLDGGDDIKHVCREFVRYRYAAPVVIARGFASADATCGPPLLRNEQPYVDVRILKAWKPYIIHKSPRVVAEEAADFRAMYDAMVK